MDTRSKILTLEEVLSHQDGKRIRWISGYFDPLLAEHARRLKQLRTPGMSLAVVVENPAHPILAQRARAELVAALSAVDYVVLDGRGVTRESLEDLSICKEFCGQVAQRARAEGCG